MNQRSLARTLCTLLLALPAASHAQTHAGVPGTLAPRALDGNGVVSGLEQFDGYWRLCAESPILPRTCLPLVASELMVGIEPTLMTASDGVTRLSVFTNSAGPSAQFTPDQLKIIDLFRVVLDDASARLTEATLRGDSSALRSGARPRSSKTRASGGSAASAVAADPPGEHVDTTQVVITEQRPIQDSQAPYQPPYVPPPNDDGGGGGNGDNNNGGSAVAQIKPVSFKCVGIGNTLVCKWTPALVDPTLPPPPPPPPINWCKLLPVTCGTTPPPPDYPDPWKYMCHSHFLMESMHATRDEQERLVDHEEAVKRVGKALLDLKGCLGETPLLIQTS